MASLYFLVTMSRTTKLDAVVQVYFIFVLACLYQSQNAIRLVLQALFSIKIY